MKDSEAYELEKEISELLERTEEEAVAIIEEDDSDGVLCEYYGRLAGLIIDLLSEKGIIKYNRYRNINKVEQKEKLSIMGQGKKSIGDKWDSKKKIDLENSPYFSPR